MKDGRCHCPESSRSVERLNSAESRVLERLIYFPIILYKRTTHGTRCARATRQLLQAPLNLPMRGLPLAQALGTGDMAAWQAQ